MQAYKRAGVGGLRTQCHNQTVRTCVLAACDAIRPSGTDSSGVEDTLTAWFFTTIEVAERLRTSPDTVRYWRHVGAGPKSFKVGRRVLYAAEDLEDYIAQARRTDSR